MALKSPLIALLTDFGWQDTYVGSLKASIFAIQNRATIVDLCHTISPQNIVEGAFVLRSVYRDYPVGTIFVCVVDPGVGSGRKPVLVVTEDYFFVGPDNGLFSYIYQLEKNHRIFILNKTKFFRHPVSSTFHGRDVFAPAAAWLSRFGSPGKVGTPMKTGPIHLSLPEPEFIRDGIRGKIMRADHFGNLFTNIRQEDFQKALKLWPDRLPCLAASKRKIPLLEFYAEGTRKKMPFVAVFSSSGFLEIAADCGNAAKLLKIGMGNNVFLSFSLK